MPPPCASHQAAISTVKRSSDQFVFAGNGQNCVFRISANAQWPSQNFDFGSFFCGGKYFWCVIYLAKGVSYRRQKCFLENISHMLRPDQKFQKVTVPLNRINFVFLNRIIRFSHNFHTKHDHSELQRIIKLWSWCGRWLIIQIHLFFIFYSFSIFYPIFSMHSSQQFRFIMKKSWIFSFEM